MGNEQVMPGPPGESAPRDFIMLMKKGTPFTFTETDLILRRYSTLDNSAEGKKGIAVDDVIMMPEFTGCPFASDTVRYLKDKDSKKIHPKQFMRICTIFCRRTPALRKKQFLFDLFDVDKQKVIGHDAMFRIFKLLLSNAISDDQILALTFSALRHPNLAHDDECTREEFADMITDNEIQEKFSIDFAFDPSLHFNAEEEEEENDEEEEDT